ncbi:MAG: hypothetical protein R3B52_01440 [Candidatus Paceibacterota bacterium]
MDILSSQQTAQKTFYLLPEAIKNWLTSDRVVEVIEHINKENQFFGERLPVIARDITRLVLTLTPPEAFTKALATDLKISEDKAGEIAAILKDKVLAPITIGLKTVQGVDIEKISTPRGGVDSLSQQKPSISAFAQARKGSLADSAPTTQLEGQATPAQGSVVPDLAPKQQPQKPDLKSDTNQQTTEKPFMLHEEAPKQPSAESAGPAFRFELPHSASQPQKQEQAPQEKARFGSFFKGINKNEAQVQPGRVESRHEEPKVVHYSAFRTILGDKDNLPK